MKGPLASGGRRRIALVAACPFPSPQGSQVFVGQMAVRLAARGHDVHLLTYGQGYEQVGKGYRHHRVARLPGDDATRSGPTPVKPWLDLLLASKLTGLVRREKIEIVHAHNYEAAIAALAVRAMTAVPVVYHSHNLMGDELETYFSGRFARAIARGAGGALDRTVPRRADRAIALCEWSRARLLEAGCAEAAVRAIPPAVDDDGEAPVTDADRAHFGLDAKDFVVGYCGNLDAYQNLPLVFEAVRRVARGTGKRVRLLVATHGAASEAVLPAAASGLGEALRLAGVDGRVEARRAIAVADVVALPRRLGSGYPIKLLNYMSAAKAVVSAGCGSKVLRDGEDGLVVPDDDPEAFAEAIEVCRRDPERRRALAAAARRSYLERLTWETVLPRIERVYAELGVGGATARSPEQAPGSFRCSGGGPS